MQRFSLDWNEKVYCRRYIDAIDFQDALRKALELCSDGTLAEEDMGHDYNSEVVDDSVTLSPCADDGISLGEDVYVQTGRPKWMASTDKPKTS